MKNCSAAVCLLWLIIAVSVSGVAQAPPSADAYATTIEPGANFGGSAFLPVQAGTTSYIRLNLGVLPVNAAISKATLRLYVNAVAAQGTFDVYQVSGAWTEQAINRNNAPELGPSATGGHSVSVTAASRNQFLLIDITALAQQWANGSVPNHGIALALTSASGSFSFDSKESAGTAHVPELEIAFAGAQPATNGLAVTSVVSKGTQLPLGPSDPYVDNGTALQPGANFNISGSGSAATLNATWQYLLGGTPVLGNTGFLGFFVGLGAGQNNVGVQNTFLGTSAGQSNTVGNYNTFAGVLAGPNNTSGSYLTFLGMQSGLSNTTGLYNSFVGTNSGLHNTTGNYNTFAGALTGLNNTTGSYLTFLGMQSGVSNTTGLYNSFVGTNAGLHNTSGNSLTFLGEQSGYSNTTGSNNSFIGTNSGFANTTGSSNTFVGFNAGSNANPAGNNNIYISSLGTSSDTGTVRIGDPANQTSAYIAGIYGSTPSGALPVVVNANGQLGTTTAGIGVTSFNGRTGAVVATANDYSFSQLSGAVGSSQLSGSYTNPLTLNNASNSFTGSFTGNGVGLTGVLPANGSSNYIQNGTAQQSGANFNISGNGSANSLNSATNYQIGGSGIVFSVGSAADQNLFLGSGAGTNNTAGTGQHNAFFGYNAGFQNTTGNNNMFSGASAGSNTTTGSFNTFLGFGAGSTITTGSSDLYIANSGCPSPCTENNTIRIGTQGTGPGQQIATFVAGIYGNTPSGALPVVVNANGQLGTTTAGIGVTSFNGRTGAVVAAANDYSFSQLSGSVNFSQVTGTVANSQLAGPYSNQMQLSNAANQIAGTFTGTFSGNGAGLTGVASGLVWPIVTKLGDYAVQPSDFSTASTEGKFLILTGTFSVSHTFTLPNPAPPNGSCVAIGSLADAGINSNANTFLKVTASPLTVDADPTLTPTQARRTSYLYCSDGSNYFRLGYQQNGVSEIGPWLKTADTGTVNAMATTFRNGMDFNLADGSVIFLLPKFANTSNIVTLNVNGLGAFKILRYGNQGLSPGDLSPNAYALLIYNSAGTKWELLNPQSTQTLSGTTATIGGSLVTAGACTTGTASVTGSIVGHPVAVSASDGSLPNGAIILSAAVTASNTVTVQMCAVADVTPAAKTYNVATQ